MSLTVDSTTYAVDLKVVRRKAETLYKYAERTEDGVLHKEIIGVYYNYDVECGMSANNVADYAALFLLITNPDEFHTITNMPGAPSGYGSFSCYFANVTDEVKRANKNGVDYFRNLSFSIIVKSPSRTP